MKEKGFKILLECWKKNKWKERKWYYEKNGYACEMIEKYRQYGRWMHEELKARDNDIKMQERREKIRESRYNAKYVELISENIPRYLERESVKEKRMIARYRCGNEERENKFWLKDEERMCRLCMKKKETLEHLLKECGGMREDKRERKDILNERGDGEEWMKEIERKREK